MMKMDRAECSKVVLIIIFSSALSCGLAILYRAGFDRNAFLTLLGAIAGSSAVVLFSIGKQTRAFTEATNQAIAAEQRRDASRDKIIQRELNEIKTTTEVMREQLRTASAGLFHDSLDISAADSACKTTLPVLLNLKSYVTTVVEHAEYISFFSRSQWRELVNLINDTLEVLNNMHEAADRSVEKLDWQRARSSVHAIENGISSANIRL